MIYPCVVLVVRHRHIDKTRQWMPLEERYLAVVMMMMIVNVWMVYKPLPWETTCWYDHQWWLPAFWIPSEVVSVCTILGPNVSSLTHSFESLVVAVVVRIRSWLRHVVALILVVVFDVVACVLFVLCDWDVVSSW